MKVRGIWRLRKDDRNLSFSSAARLKLCNCISFSVRTSTILMNLELYHRSFPLEASFHMQFASPLLRCMVWYVRLSGQLTNIYYFAVVYLFLLKQILYFLTLYYYLLKISGGSSYYNDQLLTINSFIQPIQLHCTRSSKYHYHTRYQL